MSILRTLSLVAALILPQALQAQAPHLSEIIDARMRPGWLTDQGTYMTALHLRLSRGWMTYWRHPGESGIAPRFDWSGSRNLAGARIHWPEPRLFLSAGYRSIGYKNELVLPIELTPEQAGRPIKLDGTVLLGVCDDICIPVDLSLRLNLSGPGTRDQRIADALASHPREARAAGLRSVACDVSPYRRGMRLSAALDLPAQGTQEFVLVELGGAAMPGRALPAERSGDAITGHTLLQTRTGGINRSAVQVSIITEHGMLVHQGCTLGQ